MVEEKKKQKEVTHIKIKVELKERLDEIGKKNESYNDIIERLLNGKTRK